MESNNQIELLKDIWAQIPKSETEQIVLPRDEVVRKFLSLFHPGPFFYNFFDTRTAILEYISPEVADVLGYAPDEFTLELFMYLMHPDDRPYYLHHEQNAIVFFSGLPPEKLTKYKFSHDVRLQHKNGQYIRLLIQVIPLHYFPEGGARTLNVFTDISFLKPHGEPRLSFIGLEGEPSFYNVALSKELRPIHHLFTKREMEVLRYVVKGYSSQQIAEKLFISKYTVDTHRRNILVKSNCNTTIGLITQSVKEGWA